MGKTIESFAGSKYFQLKEVASGVFAAICVPDSGSLGNASIVDLGDATLVVDTTINLQAAKDLRTAAEWLTGRPVTYVLNTHWHSDHTYGNQVFAPEARFFSTVKTREIMTGLLADRYKEHLTKVDEMHASLDEYEHGLESEQDQKIAEQLRWEIKSDREYLRTLPEARLTAADVTFEDEMQLHGSKRSVRLITYGGGHTQSDAFVYFPEEKLAIIGDLVLSGYHLTMSHANPWEWLKILDRIEELGIETIVPGHGDVCTIETLRGAREYLQYMIGLAAELGPDDASVESAVIPEKYDDWLFRFDFKSNLKKIRELSAQREVEA